MRDACVRFAHTRLHEHFATRYGTYRTSRTVHHVTFASYDTAHLVPQVVLLRHRTGARHAVKLLKKLGDAEYRVLREVSHANCVRFIRHFGPCDLAAGGIIVMEAADLSLDYYLAVRQRCVAPAVTYQVASQTARGVR